nr:MAG: hypothetical protein DIU74_05935 [Pseudomonadota bacterium]
MVRGVKLEIYFAENTKHERVDLEDWLFGAARWAGISGGVMYRAVAGYGRHGELRDGGLFDKSAPPMMACFVTTHERAQAFLDYLAKEKLQLFYPLSETEFGIVGERPSVPGRQPQAGGEGEQQ